MIRPFTSTERESNMEKYFLYKHEINNEKKSKNLNYEQHFINILKLKNNYLNFLSNF